jgi:hypothetical protein
MEGSDAERKQRFGKYSPELELLLWAVWDPIGGVPLDEYNSYVPQIWRLLEDHAGVDAIADELSGICEESMELDPSDQTPAARRLIDWWYWRFDFPVEFAAGAD